MCVAGVDGMVTFTATLENTYEVQDVSQMLQQKTWINGKKATHHISDVKAVEFVDDETVVTAGEKIPFLKKSFVINMSCNNSISAVTIVLNLQ